MGSTNTGNKEPLAVLEEVLRGGATCFQLREKGPGAKMGTEKRSFAEACQRLCQQFQVPFIVNDDIPLAIALDADGVHVGQEDMDAAAVRRLLGPTKILGVSVHHMKEAQAAIAAGADYVGTGPVYATTTKNDTEPVAGTVFITELKRSVPQLPVVGIGGITPSNFQPVIEAGADGVSVISALSTAIHPYDTTVQFKKAIQTALKRKEENQ